MEVTCLTCPISLRTSKKFQFSCPEEYSDLRYIFFLFLEETCCGYSLEVPCHGASKRNKKNVNFRASKFSLSQWF